LSFADYPNGGPRRGTGVEWMIEVVGLEEPYRPHPVLGHGYGDD
jgi:hypothetical protein